MGLTAGSAIAAEPVAGITGLMAESVGENGADYVSKVRDNMTYMPRTETGQAALQGVAEGLAPVGEWIGGQAVNLEEATGIPREATLAVPQMAAELIPAGLALRATTRMPSTGLPRTGGGLMSDTPYSQQGKINATLSPAGLGYPMTRSPYSQQGMVAWHGSPHKHSGRLDPSKIGTGEGAQAYGYGHYLAENKATGRAYQKNLSNTFDYEQDAYIPRTVEYKGRVLDMNAPSNSLDTEDLAITYVAMDKNRSPAGAIRELREWEVESAITAAERSRYKKAADWLQNKLDSGDKDIFVSPESGYLYEYDLPDSTIDQMLDWDAPLPDTPATRKLWRQVYDEPIDSMATIDGARFYDDLAEHFLGREGASDALQKAGIPGIKYYDQGSRPTDIMDQRLARAWERNKDIDSALDEAMMGVHDTPKGKEKTRAAFRKLLEERSKATRNFVIFPGNERLVTPLTRNGQPIESLMDY